jgi:hypothetical protein
MLDRAYRIGASLAIKQAEEEESNLSRNSAMAAAAAYPMAVGLINRDAVLPDAGLRTGDFSDVTKSLKPGDIVISGVSEPGSLKAQIASVTGEPDFHHVSAYLGKGRDNSINTADTAAGKMFGTGSAGGIEKDRNLRVLRLKNPNDIEALGQQMAHILDANVDYSKTRGLKAGLKELLVPKFLRSGPARDPGDLVSKQESYRRLAERLRCEGGTCSNTIGAAFPEKFNKNVEDILPNDILRSDMFDTVLEYRPTDEVRVGKIFRELADKHPDLPQQKLIEMANVQLAKNNRLNKLIGNSRNIARLGLGAAGAGLIYGASKVPGSDLSAGEAALGLGAVGLGASPFMSGSISDWARGKYLRTANEDLRNSVKELMDTGLTEPQARETLKTRVLDAAKKYINENPTNIKLEDISVTTDPSHAFYRGTESPSFDFGPRHRRISSTADKNMLLHELGHAEDFLDSVDRTRAPGIRSSLGILRDETVANRNAFRHLLKTEGVGSAMSLAKRNVVPYTTYVADVLKHLKVPGAILGTAGLAGLGYELSKEDESKKDSGLLSYLGLGE